jgi:hypothetical protein
MNYPDLPSGVVPFLQFFYFSSVVDTHPPDQGAYQTLRLSPRRSSIEFRIRNYTLREQYCRLYLCVRQHKTTTYVWANTPSSGKAYVTQLKKKLLFSFFVGIKQFKWERITSGSSTPRCWSSSSPHQTTIISSCSCLCRFADLKENSQAAADIHRSVPKAAFTL